MGNLKEALFCFLDEAEENDMSVVACICAREVVVIIPSDDLNINIFLSRFIQTDISIIAGYPDLHKKAVAAIDEIKNSEINLEAELPLFERDSGQVSLF